MKFKWKHCPVEEATWKTERDMYEKYPCVRIQVLSYFLLDSLFWFDYLEMNDG